MPSDASPTMRCIHYDRPGESRGQGDVAKQASRPPIVGATVRIVGLEGVDTALNGLKGSVLAVESNSVVVSTAAAPEAVVRDRVDRSRSIGVPLGNVRMISPSTPGMYPAHTDSSLVTVAPRSSAAGLEAKDLRTGEWFNIEDAMEPDECLVFVGDPMDYASGHRYPALMHRPAVCSGRSGQAALPQEGARISTPFFLYPRGEAVLAPIGLPPLVFDDLNGNVHGCRDRFPWKNQSCYYSDLVYSEVDGKGT
ncbi:unnamed protein product [Polarella glacialis]|uniref:Isopenicillin N synthase-like Fe(2+) 2OG dioxygenase domain-containing protein n=1 Tax=Polarella glacialis TaxID=89957 RepID=A0A813J3Y4_POLGL|nr:unnamed protein product [Polarella glacialis]